MATHQNAEKELKALRKRVAELEEFEARYKEAEMVVKEANHGWENLLEAVGATTTLEEYGTALGLFTSALGAHLTWTLPFGLLIMFAVFNRFNPAYEEAARDLGATPWQTFRHVVLPLIGPSVVGIGMFGFTLSWDEIARTSQAIGDVNTLPLELQGLTSTVTTPAIYALGTVTTVVSFAVMGLTVGLAMWLKKK